MSILRTFPARSKRYRRDVAPNQRITPGRRGFMAWLTAAIGLGPYPADRLFLNAVAELEAANAAVVECELMFDGGAETPRERATHDDANARETAARRRLFGLLDLFGEIGPVVDRGRSPFYVDEPHNYRLTHADFRPMRSYRAGRVLVMAVCDNGDILPVEPLTRLLDGRNDYRMSLIIARV